MAAEAAPAIESGAGARAAGYARGRRAGQARAAGAGSPIDAPPQPRRRPSDPGPGPETSPRRDGAQNRSEPRRSLRTQKIHRTNYQPVILMEFVATILLTAMTPIATKKDSQGLSPYAGSDIVKLSAITLVYLILAMISVGGRSWGRVAAWLGGLILLTDGLFEAANIAQDLQVLGGGGESKAKAAA